MWLWLWRRLALMVKGASTSTSCDICGVFFLLRRYVCHTHTYTHKESEQCGSIHCITTLHYTTLHITSHHTTQYCTALTLSHELCSEKSSMSDISPAASGISSLTHSLTRSSLWRAGYTTPSSTLRQAAASDWSGAELIVNTLASTCSVE
jgi:hypothetical protein